MLVASPVEKARKYIEMHSKQTEGQNSKKTLKFQQRPCITISRESGSGATEICNKLIVFFQRLYGVSNNNWTIFDKNLIEKVLQDNHLPKTLSNIMSERKYSAIKSIMSELIVGQPGIWSLVHKTIETILQLAQVGNCIILDRGANIITGKVNNTFHVRLVAPLEDRVQHIEKFFDIDRKSALEYIKREEEDRADYLMTYFHKGVNDPTLYHLIINTKLNSPEEAAKIIGEAIVNKFPGMFQIGD